MGGGRDGHDFEGMVPCPDRTESACFFGKALDATARYVPISARAIYEKIRGETC